MNIIFNSICKLRFLTVSVLSVLMVVFPFYGFKNIKLLIIPLPLLIYTIMLNVFKDNSKIALTKIHIVFIVFTLFCCCSISWSVNSSEAIHYSFNWILLCIWMITVVSANQTTQNLPIYILNTFSILTIVLFLQQAFALLFCANTGIEWNMFLNYNHNYTASLLVIVVPYFIYNNRVSTLFKWIIILLLFSLLLFINSRGALLIYSFIVLIFAIERRHRLFQISAGIAFPIISYLIFSKYFLNGSENYRMTLISHTLNLWSSSPLIGIGIGNWNILVDQFSLNVDFPKLEHIKFSRKLLAHNLFFKLLSEVGLLGLSILVIVILMVLKRCKDQFAKPFYRASFYSIIAYCIIASLYTFGDFNKFDFSAHILVFVTVLGIISSNKHNLLFTLRILFVFPFITFLWFFYSTYNFHFFEHISRLDNTQKTNQLLLKLYQPSIYSIGRFNDLPLSLQIALSYEKLGDNEKSNQFYKQGLIEFPFSFEIKLAYSEFLLRKMKDVDYAFLLASEALKIQPYNMKLNILMAEIEIIRENYMDALKYLHRFYHNDLMNQQNVLYNFIFIQYFDLEGFGFQRNNLTQDLITFKSNDKHNKNRLVELNKITKAIEIKIIKEKNSADFFKYYNYRYKNYVSFYSSVFSKELNCNSNQSEILKEAIQIYLFKKKKYKLKNLSLNIKEFDFNDSILIINNELDSKMKKLLDSEQYHNYLKLNIKERIN